MPLNLPFVSGPDSRPTRPAWTRSGKVILRILRKIAAGDTSDLGDIPTLADPAVVEKLVEAAAG